MTAVAWSVAEVRVLRQACEAGKTPSQILLLFPHRTKSSLRKRMLKLGLLSESNGSASWNAEDDELLARGFGEELTDAKIHSKYLPHRTIRSIRRRRNGLHLHRYVTDRPNFDVDADLSNISLAASSKRLLSVLATYHRHRAGELNIPSDGCSVKRVSSFVVPDNLIASHAQRCTEVG